MASLAVRIRTASVLVLLFSCDGSPAGTVKQTGGVASGGSNADSASSGSTGSPIDGDGGSTAGSSSGAHSGGGSTAGSGSGAHSGGGSTAGSSSGAGSGGNTGIVVTNHCEVIDGQRAYGPIGERQTLSMTAWSIFGFRTAAGYGVVWRTDSDATSNLFTMSLDLAFQGGAERALPSDHLLDEIDVVPVSGGFVVATCSRDSESQWIRLDGELAAVVGTSLVAPDAPCGKGAPGILWTGERYLTSFTDARGLVVAALDAEGSLAAEVVLSARVAEPVVARFSKNGDRVLFAYNEENAGRGLAVVLDLAGAPLGDVQAFGKEDSGVMRMAITPSGDGWLVANDSGSLNDTGLLLTVISRDGLVGQETRSFGPSVARLESTPSAHGGSLVIGQIYTGGQYGANERLTVLVDEAGRVVYDGEHDDPAFFPVGVIVDPLRDLVIEKPEGEDAVDQPLTVQEYGCLD